MNENTETTKKSVKIASRSTKKSSKAMKKHSFEVEGQAYTAQTNCLTFGQPIRSTEDGSIISDISLGGMPKCAKCPEETQALCLLKNGPFVQKSIKKINNSDQNRCALKRGEVGVNWLGHTNGCIGDKIDRLIKEGKWTKAQIEAKAGTKMSKVNSHIHHLKKDKKQNIKIENKVVCFA